jgi:hypothetical protein
MVREFSPLDAIVLRCADCDGPEFVTAEPKKLWPAND